MGILPFSPLDVNNEERINKLTSNNVWSYHAKKEKWRKGKGLQVFHDLAFDVKVPLSVEDRYLIPFGILES